MALLGWGLLVAFLSAFLWWLDKPFRDMLEDLTRAKEGSGSPSTVPALSAADGIHLSVGGRGILRSVTLQWRTAPLRWEIQLFWASGSSSKISVPTSSQVILGVYVQDGLEGVVLPQTK